jgi:hypothetical protein
METKSAKVTNQRIPNAKMVNECFAKYFGQIIYLFSTEKE